MATPRYDRATYLAQELTAAGIPAVVDVDAVAPRAPCVLVPPPRMAFTTYSGSTVTWRLVVVSAGTSAGAAAAWRDLDEFVDRLAAELPIETADPTAYVLPDGSSVPAYAITLTEVVR